MDVLLTCHTSICLPSVINVRSSSHIFSPKKDWKQKLHTLDINPSIIQYESKDKYVWLFWHTTFRGDDKRYWHKTYVSSIVIEYSCFSKKNTITVILITWFCLCLFDISSENYWSWVQCWQCNTLKSLRLQNLRMWHVGGNRRIRCY